MKKELKAVSVVFVVAVGVLLLSMSLVSAFSFSEFLSDLGKSIKSFFDRSGGEGLEGALKSLGVGGSSSYIGSQDYGSSDYGSSDYPQPKLTCKDSDTAPGYLSGKNYGLKGTCTDNTQQISDECSSFMKSLRESFCLDNVCKFEYYDCGKEGKVCRDGGCVEEEEDILIEEDIGELEFVESYFTNCETLDDVGCDRAKTGLYNYSKGGVESIKVSVENYVSPFTDENFKNSVEKLYGEGADYSEIEHFYQNNLYIFGYKISDMVSSLVIAWYDGDKIILIKINRWDDSVLDDDLLEFLIEKYLEKYPSDLVDELNGCHDLRNEVILKIQELLGLGENVVLREGDSIKQGEYFVIPDYSRGRILQVSEISITPGGADSDYVIFTDIINSESFKAEGNFFDEPRTFKTSEYDEFTVSANEAEVRVSWKPENIIITFYNCKVVIPPTQIILVYDDENGYPDEDIDFLEDLRNQIYSKFENVYVDILRNDWYIKEMLSNAIGVFVYDGRALVIEGANIEEDGKLASSIHEYLISNPNNYLICQDLVSSEELTSDLKESLNSLCVVDTTLCKSCGFAGFFCDREECESIEEGCYFVDVPFGLNECNSCRGLTCSDHDEESDCYSGACKLECEWEVNQCIEKQPLKVQLSFSTEKDSYSINEIIKLLGGS